MGVPGLFDALKPISRKIELDELRGLTLGVDGYGWLHRGAFSCAEELVDGTRTAKYLGFFNNKVQLLHSLGVSLYFVFDGRDLPLKDRINAQRAAARAQARKQPGARPMVNVTEEMAAGACYYLKKRGIPYVVAPYEADAQLVWLEQNGLVDAILSEDSDLFIFGAKRLVCKFKDQGATLVNAADMHKAPILRPIRSPEMLRAMAILSGCDYSPGILGLGVVKASKMLVRAGSLEGALAMCQASPEFIAQAEAADLCFQFQRVWDVVEQCEVGLGQDETDSQKELASVHTRRMALAEDTLDGRRLALPQCITDYCRHVPPLQPIVKASTSAAERKLSVLASPGQLGNSPFFKVRVDKVDKGDGTKGDATKGDAPIVVAKGDADAPAASVTVVDPEAPEVPVVPVAPVAPKLVAAPQPTQITPEAVAYALRSSPPSSPIEFTGSPEARQPLRRPLREVSPNQARPIKKLDLGYFKYAK